MTVLFAEGFTGSPNTAPNNWSTNTLRSLGWTLNALYNGSNAGIADDGVVVLNIEADPLFPTRSQVSLKKNSAAATLTLLEQMYRPLPALANYQKYVVGMMAMFSSGNAAQGGSWHIVGGTVPLPSTTQNYPISDFLMMINFLPNDAGAVLYMPPTFYNGTGIQLPGIKRGVFYHVEILVEKDAGRVRVYIDGVLKGDASSVPNINGLGLTHLMNTSSAGVHDLKISNIYMLGLDSVHTGILGANARVLEVPMGPDNTVQWARPESFPSNSAVLAQYFTNPTPSYLTSGTPGEADYYNGPDSITANAAQIYGVAVKLNAMSMTPGSHGIVSSSRRNGTVLDGTLEMPLTLGVKTTMALDASVDPSTGAVWTPQGVVAGQVGFKLLR